MQSDVNFPLVPCKPATLIIQPKFNQCKRFVLHPHFLFIYLTISILGSSIIFGLSLKYTLRFVPSNWRVQLTDKGCKAAQMGLARYLKRQTLMEKLKEYKLFVGIASATVSFVSMLITLALTIYNAVKL